MVSETVTKTVSQGIISLRQCEILVNEEVGTIFVFNIFTIWQRVYTVGETKAVKRAAE